ncbi:phosphate-starvation-inducible protein PsiE [Thiorhodococcus fuscus]|uniref:Protein PsiE n=1 Tax=Thiorhodococcus fuscus TaxID=527200 RepID=A0ABW4Y707_9GAMM
MTSKPRHPRVARLVGRALTYVELVGLCAITVAAVIAGGQAILEMIALRTVTLADLLLLFIYLEVLSMVTVYLESGALPVRMPLYIAMVALARHLILDMKGLTEWQLIASSVAVLILAAAVLLIRFGHVRYPYEVSRESGKLEE